MTVPLSSFTAKFLHIFVTSRIGDYVGEEYQDGEQIQTTNLDADYAVKISGHSMEPTYPDGCIVLVPDNKSGEFPDEIITEEMSCNFQGKVLGQKKDFDS